MTLELLHFVVAGKSLSEEQAESAMRTLLAGESTPVLTASFLTALHMKGETVEELTGFARAMRAAALSLPIPSACRPILDTCGTGGNKTAGFNISTTAAFVIAGAGVRVAKHGNRSITSRSGSADLLEALGVRTMVSPEVVARSVEKAGIGFLFAPLFHGSVKHVQPVRLELKFRTAFNFLGPLTNPAGAEMQVAGTWSVAAAELIAGALSRLGLARGFVVHGDDGMGEVTISGPTTVFSIRDGGVERLRVSPEDFGFAVQHLDGIRGGDVAYNRSVAEAVLRGERGAARDTVAMNAAMGLVVAGKTESWREAAAMACEAIDSGAAWAALESLRAVTTAG
ncbi:MAG: anthranilate phosphoribosyltransferase [Bryobacterales bacterium]|nr:anthranilate phosphoribosyltransferase [Bryobacterales bacterium]